MSKRLLTRLVGVGLGLLGALGTAELTVRLARPYNVQRAGNELPLFDPSLESSQRFYVPDEELGFRPVFGTPLFDLQGVRPNTYGEQPAEGVERVLFLGDSVTFRARILRALRTLAGEERFEYLNGGVEAYNTTQEVLYFERYTSNTSPDRIVLTFHHNDFQSTPISFRDGQGRLRVIAPSRHRDEVQPWLFAHSHLYRYWIGATRTPGEREAREAIRAGFERLASWAEQHDVEFSVLVLPPLRPLEEWKEVHHRRHDFALETLTALGIRHFDLLPGLREALDRGIEFQETPGDVDHPNDALAEIFARRLMAAGLLTGG